ncbi:YJR142W [Saccharomyces arboricola H-6]|uniref:YJR142W n=1 Tax=Saccharomyces arboricola (strain H-6 / AS 2.3317 / CBS 10644) TaxID=1160507 RepID=J8Q6A0_SACAR|nr:YJR142W [Saccharomyces arboricola H-6]
MKVEESANGLEVLVRTEEDDREGFSFLEIMDRVDPLQEDFENHDNFKREVYYMCTHNGIRIGYVLGFAINEMKTVCKDIFEETFRLDEVSHELRFKSEDFEHRNNLVDQLARKMYIESSMNGVKGWRDEKYAIWVNRNPYVLIERAMAGVLGIVTYGVHINGYVLSPESKKIQFWIPRRSKTKQTWPLMLDNIIAGGIGYPCGIYETVLKESIEEANLEKSIIEENIKAAGVVSYLYFTGDILTTKFDKESDFIVGEVEYVYDLKLGKDIIPKPNDGEVESFSLLSLQETIDALKKKKFKPNCAVVTVDFLIRHGYITPENEPNYLELMVRMHRRLPFPTLN